MTASEAWYEGIPQSEEDRLYEESAKRVLSAVRQGMGFEQAASLIDVKDEEIKKNILEDALKMIIAEMHFAKEVSLEKLSGRLALPLKRLEEAKKAMLEEVEEAAVEKFRKEAGARQDLEKESKPKG